jgi:hypothetical protein
VFAGGGPRWLVGSLSISGSYYQVLQMMVAGAETSAVAWLPGSNTVTWSTVASDGRLKFNRSPAAKDALAIVAATTVYDCDYRHPGAMDPSGEHWDFTILADDLKKVLPFAYLAPPQDGFASLHPLHLIATLWRAVQQLTDLVASLENTGSRS